MKFLKKLVKSNKVEEKVVGNTSTGDMVLGYGQHEVAISVNGTPCKVSINLKTPCGSATICHGDINKVGITISDNGFVLYADIKTNTCAIEWVCEV